MAVHQLTCCGCSVQFTHHRRKAYCTRNCREAARRRRMGIPEKYADGPAVVHTDHECMLCGQMFRPKKSCHTKFCSRECGLKWTGTQTAARANGCRITYTVTRLRCIKCNGRFTRASGRSLKCEGCADVKPPSAYKPIKGTVRQCAVCSAEFIAMGGGEFSSLKFCSKSCKNIDMRKKPGHRDAQKAAKARRRARRKGAAVCERVSPLRVFERDAWRCGICGRKTLKSKRGSTHPKAPELDHIVALANGGDHSYRNVQCACRQCNGAKGASDYGQIPLFAKP